MQTRPARVAIATLVIAGLGAAVNAAPSFHSPLRKAVRALQSDENEKQWPYEWSLASVIQSGLVHRGVSFFVGDTYANYQGRTFELRQEQIKLGITDKIEIY